MKIFNKENRKTIICIIFMVLTLLFCFWLNEKDVVRTVDRWSSNS